MANGDEKGHCKNAKMQKLIQFGCAEDTILYLYFGG